MANCVSYECNDPIGTHTPNDCGVELLAGGSGIILLECNSQLTDPSSAAQINAEIAAGRAVKIDDVKIGINDPSPVQIEANKIGAAQTLVTYDRSGSILDGNVNINNNEMYSKLFSGRTFGGAIIYLKGTEDSTQALVYFIDAPITFTGGLAIKNNNDENMRFSGTFNWRSRSMPELVNAPVGIFV